MHDEWLNDVIWIRKLMLQNFHNSGILSFFWNEQKFMWNFIFRRQLFSSSCLWHSETENLFKKFFFPQKMTFRCKKWLNRYKVFRFEKRSKFRLEKRSKFRFKNGLFSNKFRWIRRRLLESSSFWRSKKYEKNWCYQIVKTLHETQCLRTENFSEIWNDDWFMFLTMLRKIM